MPDEDQVMALSILTVFVSVFAFAPAPAIVSAVVGTLGEAFFRWKIEEGVDGWEKIFGS